MSEDAMIQLHRRKQGVDLGKLGLYSGTHVALTGLDLRTLRDTMAAFAVAQAQINVIGTTESGLTVRPIYQNLDLLDGQATPAAIPSTVWRQPATSGNYTSTDGFTPQVIYNTDRISKNDQKIIVIFGFRAINVGNTRTQPFLKSTQAHFWRKGTKIIDIWDYQQLNSSNESFVAAVTPIMYKKNDLAEIKIVANEDTADASKVDGLEVLGIIVEGLGQNVMG
jgi:hypothetical protein